MFFYLHFVSKPIKFGLKANWKQFTLLVIVNAFVGGMVGIERSILPNFAQEIFGIASKTAILSFIIAFGISKAFTNYFTGKLVNWYGRKFMLLVGWLIAMPIPFLLIYAPSWNWVIFANVLLGISQGITWSTAILMKIDLVGEKDRGFAMGLNEFAGYLAVGLASFVSSYLAGQYGFTPYIFYLGVLMSALGFIISLWGVNDTQEFVNTESRLVATKSSGHAHHTFLETTFKNKTLSAVTQAGLVNNLNDGMMWGILPVFLFSLKFSAYDIALITAIYPMVWGISQVFTGKLSDIYNKKHILFLGMLLQGLVILLIPFMVSFSSLFTLAILLGLGTALVYPTFIATIAQVSHPKERAESIGIFRLWRDLGYAFGAIVSGIVADYLGINYAIIIVGILTVLSAVILGVRMKN
jgi:MFS family permease